MTAHYNENDPFAVAWLKKLVRRNLINPGVVDARDIQDLQPEDLRLATQFHAFAGIGGWSYALRLAGWPDDRPVWTGSCPCQPFSAAGKGGGFEDSRHLWPAWFRLIRECRPPVVFGEQVASAAGLAWFDHVSTDLEAEDYAVGAADLCAAGVGAPHVRQRLFFVAHEFRSGLEGRVLGRTDSERENESRHLGCSGPTGSLAHAGCQCRREVWAKPSKNQPRTHLLNQRCRTNDSSLGHPEGGDGSLPVPERRSRQDQPQPHRPGPWSDLLWLPCRDGKARPTQPGIQPLAHGVPNRVGTLRGAGNAIVPQVAAEFIRACLEIGY